MNTCKVYAGTDEQAHAHTHEITHTHSDAQHTEK